MISIYYNTMMGVKQKDIQYGFSVLAVMEYLQNRKRLIFLFALNMRFLMDWEFTLTIVWRLLHTTTLERESSVILCSPGQTNLVGFNELKLHYLVTMEDNGDNFVAMEVFLKYSIYFFLTRTNSFKAGFHSGK